MGSRHSPDGCNARTVHLTSRSLPELNFPMPQLLQGKEPCHMSIVTQTDQTLMTCPTCVSMGLCRHTNHDTVGGRGRGVWVLILKGG